jgi:hypothetical protein
MRSSSVQIRIYIQDTFTCAPCSMIITSSLFIGFECMSNDWKFDKLNYEFGIGNFLRLYLD